VTTCFGLLTCESLRLTCIHKYSTCFGELHCSSSGVSQHCIQAIGICHANYVDCLLVWPGCNSCSITLVDLQLDAQNSYLLTYNIFIKILYMFWALPCSSSGGLRRNCVCAASGIVTLCRWLSYAPVKKKLLNRCTGQSHTDSDDTRGCICKIMT
jgi:hypothetical protein